jgi:endonuclease/exonuclease/phosphatase family metal-dependent hydrolase
MPEESSELLRVCTFNIAHGRGLAAHQLFLTEDRIKSNLANIANFLFETEIDIAGLQEVDVYSFWSGYFQHGDFLLDKLNGMDFLNIGEHVSFKKLKYGTAILSKFPQSNSISQTFSGTGAWPKKGFVISQLCWPSFKFDFDVVSLHLDFRSKKIRQKQITDLVDAIRFRGKPVILLGDLNSQWHETSSAVKQLSTMLSLNCFEPDSKKLATFQMLKKRLDWILISDEFKFNSYNSGPNGLSDHLPVTAQVALNV